MHRAALGATAVLGIAISVSLIWLQPRAHRDSMDGEARAKPLESIRQIAEVPTQLSPAEGRDHRFPADGSGSGVEEPAASGVIGPELHAKQTREALHARACDLNTSFDYLYGHLPRRGLIDRVRELRAEIDTNAIERLHDEALAAGQFVEIALSRDPDDPEASTPLAPHITRQMHFGIHRISVRSDGSAAYTTVGSELLADQFDKVAEVYWLTQHANGRPVTATTR